MRGRKRVARDLPPPMNERRHPSAVFYPEGGESRATFFKNTRLAAREALSKNKCDREWVICNNNNRQPSVSLYTRNMYSPNRSDASCALIHQSNGSTKHGYKHASITSIQAYKFTSIQVYKHTSIQATYKQHTSNIQATYKLHTSIQVYKHTSVQVYKHTKHQQQMYGYYGLYLYSSSNIDLVKKKSTYPPTEPQPFVTIISSTSFSP